MADGEPVGDARVPPRRHIQVAVHHHPLPHVVAKRVPGEFLGALSGLLIIARREVSPRRSFGQVVPVITPGTFDRSVAARAFRPWRGQEIPRQQPTPKRAQRLQPGQCQRNVSEGDQPPAIGAMIWYSSAYGSNTPSSRTCCVPTFFETAQPLSRASRRMRSASRTLSRASSVSVSASHSTSWCPRRLATMMRPTAEPSLKRVLVSQPTPE